MGAWGYESSASDHCWDALWAANIHEMTQKEADDTIDKLLKSKTEDYCYHSVVLGVVTHILYQELKVSDKALKLAIKCADEMLDKNGDSWEENVNNYDNVPERIRMVKAEKEACEQALKNKGKGTRRHVKGLLEKIFSEEK